jgi:hypothetical protein
LHQLLTQWHFQGIYQAAGGSFGTEKEHYGLQRIKARTDKTEILWIFFGVHTANAVRIAKRLTVPKVEQEAA